MVKKLWTVCRVNLSRTFLKAVLIVALVASLILTVLNMKESKGKREIVKNKSNIVLLSDKELTDDARECIPVPYGIGNTKIIGDCVRDVFISAGYDVSTPARIFESASKFDPFFADACHLGSHEAGKMLALGKNPAAALKVTSSVCSSGLIHGIFDAIGETSQNTDTWKSFANICEELRDKQPAACADGMGHAAWDVTGDVVAAETICLSFSNVAAREECAEGVVMQRFEPATDKADRKREIRPHSLAEICRVDSDPSILKGCWRGTGWLLANDLAARADSQNALRGFVSAKSVRVLTIKFTKSIK
jgi:hypothetical protein